jgi:hypothetical protein
VYVDDILIIETQQFFDSFIKYHSFKFEVIGKSSFHLLRELCCDTDGTFPFGAQFYVAKVLINYYSMFGSKPKDYCTPITKNDLPEIDKSELND